MNPSPARSNVIGRPVMQTFIQIINQQLPISLHRAKVIHSDKFSQTTGGAFNLPVTSTLYNYVVFRNEETQEEWPLYVKNINPDLYPDKKVTLIIVANKILGYIDEGTSHYYFTTREYSKLLNLGLPFYFFMIVGLIGALVAFFIFKEQYLMLSLIISFIIAWLLHQIQKLFLNYRTKKAVDSFLQ